MEKLSEVKPMRPGWVGLSLSKHWLEKVVRSGTGAGRDGKFVQGRVLQEWFSIMPSSTKSAPIRGASHFP